MGVSNNGILTFGVEVGSEDYPPIFLDDFDNDWDNFLDSIGGYPTYGEPGYDYKNRKKFEEELGVTLVSHCSYNYPMFILSVNGEKFSCSRGDATVVDPREMVVTSEQIQKLKDFWFKYVENDDIEYDEYEEKPVWQEPQWLLVTMNG